MKDKAKRKLKSLLPYIGQTTVRKRIDEIFSRRMLGSVLLGSSAGKVVEKLLNLIFDTTFTLFIGWSVSFVVFAVLFIYWDVIETAVDEATDN